MKTEKITGLNLKFYWSCAGGPVLIVRSRAGGPVLIVRNAFYALWFYYSQTRFKLFGFPILRFWAYWSEEGYSRNVGTKLDIYVCITGLRNKYVRYIKKSTAHGCWTLDLFVSDIKLQAIYKVIHTSNLSTDWGQHFLQVYWVSS